MTSMAVIRSERSGRSGQAVELQVPASFDQLAVVRGAVATVAATLDLTIDSVADARLAVDETCTALMRISSEDAVLACRIAGTRRRIDVRCSTTVETGEPVSKRGLSWYVLSSLTEGLTTGTDQVLPGGPLSSVWIEWTIADDQAE